MGRHCKTRKKNQQQTTRVLQRQRRMSDQITYGRKDMQDVMEKVKQMTMSKQPPKEGRGEEAEERKQRRGGNRKRKGKKQTWK